MRLYFKSEVETVFNIKRSQGLSIAYILKSLMVAILILCRWPKINNVHYRYLGSITSKIKFELDW